MTQHTHNNYLRFFSVLILCAFLTTTIFPPQIASAQVNVSILNLPPVGTMISTSSGFNPPIIRGLTVHPENPLQFDFIIDGGDEDLQGEDLRIESEKLIKYFLASLTVPEEEMWVNLSPYEKDRIIPNHFGQTEMGRDLLAQDYILKQLTASLMFPEDELGGEFWERVYKKAQEKFGTTDIPMNTFNKIWIVPEKAEIHVHNNDVFVVDSHLKVLLEEDYLALESNKDSTTHGLGNKKIENIEVFSGVSSAVVREVLIPEIEKEVNSGKNFANLGQMCNSMILAVWFKKNLKNSLLGNIYVDQSKINGVELKDQGENQKIYEQYVQAFKAGVYDYIREDYDSTTNKMIPRKYFSGGFQGSQLSKVTSSPIGSELKLAKILSSMKNSLNSVSVNLKALGSTQMLEKLTKVLSPAKKYIGGTIAALLLSFSGTSQAEEFVLDFSFSEDKNLGMYHSSNLRSMHQSLGWIAKDKIVDRFESGFFRNTLEVLGVAYLGSALSLIGHEQGHGNRFNEFGLNPSYQYDWSRLEAVTYPKGERDLTTEENIYVDSGGVETDKMLGQNTFDYLFFTQQSHYRLADLIFAEMGSTGFLTYYAFYNNEETSDLLNYSSRIDKKYNTEDFITDDDLKQAALFDLLDPTLWLGGIKIMKYMFKGDEDFTFPNHLPALWTSLTPSGISYNAGVRSLFKNSDNHEILFAPYVGYIDRPEKTYLAGFRVKEMPIQRLDLNVDAFVDVWVQPDGDSGFNTYVDLRKGLFEFEKTQFQLTVGIGYKEEGHVAGRPLEEGVYGHLGFRIKQKIRKSGKTLSLKLGNSTDEGKVMESSLVNEPLSKEASSSLGVVHQKGGIDLNPQNLDLQIEGDAIDFDLKFDEDVFRGIEVDGFVPIIINIFPISVPQWLAVLYKEDSNTIDLAKEGHQAQIFVFQVKRFLSSTKFSLLSECGLSF